VDQLRLRNMGGIIIIDFIDMEAEVSRDKVHKALDEAVKRDRARTNVLRISELGLVEMTRKRVQEGLDRYLNEECLACHGSGVVRSRSTLCFEIMREVRREFARTSTAAEIFVNCPPAVADLLYGAHFSDLEVVEQEIGRRVVVRPVAHFNAEQYEVYAR
jgi:ribonuclease G